MKMPYLEQLKKSPFCTLLVVRATNAGLQDGVFLSCDNIYVLTNVLIPATSCVAFDSQFKVVVLVLWLLSILPPLANVRL